MNNKDNFKKDLKLIEIETFSYCNRVCWFCPNSIIDRRSDNKIMSVKDYKNILKQLQEIDYSNEITFSRYNEPLAKKDIILERIKMAKEMVPNSILRINTNGDYVTQQYIEELKNAGLNQLWIQQYLANDERYNHEKVKKAMLKKIKKLGYWIEPLTDIQDCKIEYKILVQDMTVHIRARNFDLDGSDRGGVVPIAEDYQRTQACTQVFRNMYIDFNGQIMVCCALRSDVPEHVSGKMGHIKNGNLWDIFYSKPYFKWRQAHAENGKKEGLCKGCRIDVKPSYEK